MEPDLCSVQAEVVTPAVRRVLKPAEPAEINVRLIGPSPATGRWSVELQLMVAGEEFLDIVFDSQPTHMSMADWADHLTSHLEDFVAESRFGWGQDRRPGP